MHANAKQLRVLVLDTNKKELMPTHPARARKLLDAGKAAVYRRYPFTIILKYAVQQPQTQPIELKVDPGSKTTGISIVALFKRGWTVLWAANLAHRGLTVKKNLESRRQSRRSRRNRKTRYRKQRGANRSRTSFEYIEGERVGLKSANNSQSKKKTGRPSGWISPSLMSRVDNVYVWASRLKRWCPITSIQVETVRFDTQLMENPEISGVEYQQGQLQGYEVREYLLEKWGRKCAYCGAENVPLEVEHIVPKSRGGNNRVSNLTLACNPCNVAKGKQTAAEFGYPDIQAQAKQSLRDAAAVNATRYATGNALKSLGLSVGFWSGGRTKYNRIKQGYDKDHWLDAVCVGESGQCIRLPAGLEPLQIKATGRQSRQMCRVDSFGFPRTKAKHNRIVKGFQTGDIVRAVVPKGKKAGTHIGRIAVRAKGSFRVGKVDGINWKYCTVLHRADGYEYQRG